jgi:hypothetical protein
MCAILSTNVPVLRFMKDVVIRTDMIVYTFYQNRKSSSMVPTGGKLFSLASSKTRSKKVGASVAGNGEVRMVRTPSAAGGVKNVTLTCEHSFL